MTITNPICAAIDTPELPRALMLVKALRSHVGYVKLGLEFFYANGAAGYAAVAAEGVPVFLDLKLHDIPNTVEQGLTSLMKLVPPPAILNVHGHGGPSMLRAARRAVPASTKLIAVTVLTSMTDEECFDTGHDIVGTTLAEKLARLAKQAGLDGVVCSAHDLKRIRKAQGRDFLTVVPGIRPEGTDSHDQKRIATPQAALAAGADILVIGRAITGAADPAAAARAILEGLA